MDGRRQKNLILIVARELASKLATAMFIADAEGDVVFYNEPAEEILGRTFAEAGELSAENWTSLFHPETLDGGPMALAEMPTGIALLEQKPAHDIFRITCLDGKKRVVSVTGVPLFAQADRFVGMLAVFWELPEPRESQEPRLRVTIWGCRGSLATPGPGTLRYGGNTSCLEVRLRDGTLLVLDAGTGIRPLGLELGTDRPRTIHLLLTHLHFDHLEGLGFFAPLWVAETDLHVWGPPSPVRTLEERIARYLSPPLFPVQLSDVPAQMTFHDVPDEEWEIGGGRLLAQPVSHPGPTVGYRLSEDGRSLAYIPDHEPALGVDLSTLAPEWMSGHALAEGVDFLLHDSQYSEDEYPARVGWGHSSVEQAVAFARISHSRRLVMFHHDPGHGDKDLEKLLSRAGELWGGEGEPPLLAYEGMELELS